MRVLSVEREVTKPYAASEAEEALHEREKMGTVSLKKREYALSVSTVLRIGNCGSIRSFSKCMVFWASVEAVSKLMEQQES